jgi:type 1 fimbria pilin
MMHNVRKTVSACAITVALFAASSGAYAAAPGSTEVRFIATVTESTCTPGWNAATGIDVNFDKVRSENLNASGIAKRPFTLRLSDCQNVAGVQVSATGTADTQNNKAFANTESGDNAAKNVAFILLAGPDQNTPLMPNSGNVEYKIGGDGSTIEMPFMAELVSTGHVKPGAASGIATLNMTYE